MKEQKLLTEINRMKEIMGLPLLKEGIPGVFGDMMRTAFGATVEAATGKLQRVVGSLGGAISDDLADELVSALPRLLDDVNVWDELSDAARKGFMRVFREIPEMSQGIYDNILKQIDVTADEFAGAVIETMSSKNLSYEDAIIDILSAGEVSDDVADIVQKNLRKTYDEMVSTGSNIVNPLSKRIRTQAEALTFLEETIGVPIAKLRKIDPKLSTAIDEAAKKMIGKTLEDSYNDVNRILKKFSDSPKFQKAWKRSTNTPWENFKMSLETFFNKWFVGYEKEGFPWPWAPDKLDRFGNRIPSMPKTVSKTIGSGVVLFLGLSYVLNVIELYLEGMPEGDAVLDPIHDYSISVFKFLHSFGVDIGEYRDEQSELTDEEAVSAFTPVATKLGFKVLGPNDEDEGYVLEKVDRGVFRAVPFIDNPNAADYVIIKRDGETYVTPWTDEMNNTNWEQLFDDKFKEWRAKIGF